VFLDSWAGVGRVLAVGTVTYLALVLVLRVSGKRTLAKLNAFDLVVTVALGSTLATVLLSEDVSFAEGMSALVLLVAAQFLIAWFTVRSDLVRRSVRSRPTLVAWQGRVLHDSATRQRVTEGEVRQAVRSQGIGDLGDVTAVILETDGTFSVIPTSSAGGLGALADIPDLPPQVE
jgi:uncharacterized membrane protein YcaP (DUF421 family)